MSNIRAVLSEGQPHHTPPQPSGGLFGVIVVCTHILEVHTTGGQGLPNLPPPPSPLLATPQAPGFSSADPPPPPSPVRGPLGGSVFVGSPRPSLPMRPHHALLPHQRTPECGVRAATLQTRPRHCSCLATRPAPPQSHAGLCPAVLRAWALLPGLPGFGDKPVT